MDHALVGTTGDGLVKLYVVYNPSMRCKICKATDYRIQNPQIDGKRIDLDFFFKYNYSFKMDDHFKGY